MIKTDSQVTIYRIMENYLHYRFICTYSHDNDCKYLNFTQIIVNRRLCETRFFHGSTNGVFKEVCPLKKFLCGKLMIK